MAMDVSPMSLQMVFPRATEAGQVQHNLNHAAALQQEFETVRQEQEAKLKQQQVRNKENPEDGRIKENPDRRHGQGGYSASGRRNRQTEEEEKEKERFAADPSRGHRIDISF